MIRDLTIHAVLNGFEVKVGCQTVVFTDITEMLKEIRRYLKKPEEIEKEYLEKALNAKHMVPVILPGNAYYAPPYPQTSSAPTYTTTWESSSSSNTQWVPTTNVPGLTNVKLY